MNVQERFLHYVSFDTQSDEHSQTTPSSLKQLKLAEALVDEMKAIGITDAYVLSLIHIYALKNSKKFKKIVDIKKV